jgi:hypothetical protein
MGLKEPKPTLRYLDTYDRTLYPSTASSTLRYPYTLTLALYNAYLQDAQETEKKSTNPVKNQRQYTTQNQSKSIKTNVPIMEHTSAARNAMQHNKGKSKMDKMTCLSSTLWMARTRLRYPITSATKQNSFRHTQENQRSINIDKAITTTIAKHK